MLYHQKIEDASISTIKIKESKDIIDNNYQLIKTLLNTMPEHILSVEDNLIKKMTAANIKTLENIQK